MDQAVKPNIRRHISVASFVSIFCTIAFLSCLALQFAGLRLTHVLSPEQIGPLRGYSYAYVVPRPWSYPVLQAVGDTSDARYSRLILTENGQPLSLPHASGPSIDQVGAGRYAHLRKNELYFSTSDNTDPRANGRVYELSVPVTPKRGLTSTFFFLAIASAAVAMGLSRASGRRERPGQAWPWVLAIAGFATFWQMMILTETPRIIVSGDGGVVAGIAAAELHPERLEGDLVYGEKSNYAFYWTVTIPLTKALAQITGDVGTAYALLMGPLLVVQMVGFLILGRRLFGRHDLAAALAFMSVAPVYVISGELWGSLSEPITRYTYNALLPYLLLVALPPHRRMTPYAVMALCGLGVYLHPVSAPSVALALWFALAVMKRPDEPWLRHGFHMVLAGGVFLLAAAPFVINFINAFPSGGEDPVSSSARELLRESVGGPYHNVLIALAQFVRYAVKTQAGTFGFLWLALIGSVLVLSMARRRMDPSIRSDLSFFGLVAAGVLIASVGVTAVDQTLAFLRGSDPVQVDLIRNIRFLVPVSLVLMMTWLVWRARTDVGPRAPYWRIATWAFAVMWLFSHQSLPVARLFGALEFQRPYSADDVHARDMLRRLKGEETSGSVLVIPATLPTESSELMALALRYGAQRPSFFQLKDLNLLSYSGSAEIIEWNQRRKDVAALEASDTVALVNSSLRDLSADTGPAFLLVHADEPAARLFSISPLLEPVYDAGPWTLYALN